MCDTLPTEVPKARCNETKHFYVNDIFRASNLGVDYSYFLVMCSKQFSLRESQSGNQHDYA